MLDQWMSLRWTTLLVRGVVGVGFGVLAMAWPDKTVVVLVVLWGCWAVVDGVMTIGQAGGAEDGRSRAVMIALGLVSLVVAFFALVRPGVAASTVTWIIGAWLVLRGVSELFGAIGATGAGRWALVFSGLLDGVIGGLFLANPGGAAVSLAFVLGLCAVVWGIVIVVVALAVRRATRSTTTTAHTDAAFG